MSEKAEGRRKKKEGRKRKFFYFSLIFLLSSTFYLLTAAYATQSSVDIKAIAVPSRVKVGDEIRLLIQAERPKRLTLVPPPIATNVAPFEIKKVETSPYVEGKNRVRETFIVTLTVFELGDLKIPAIPISTRDESGRVGQVMTEPVLIKVVSVGKKPTDKDDVRPIKGPVSYDLSFLRVWLSGIAAALLAIFLTAKIIIRRRQKKLIDLESLKPPHERAFLELERLKKKGFLEAGKVKEFYSELADILRRYFERRFAIDSFELTTFEMLKDLKEKNFENDIIEKTKEVLGNSDLVKFAKYVPPRSLADELAGKLTDIVNQTKPKEEEKR